MDKQYKMLIPNYLTLARIILTPFIIIFGLLNFIGVVTFLAIIAAITDFFDGYLARKWNAVSKSGAKLDAVADKVFAIGLIISLIPSFKLFTSVLLLEIIIGIVNLYFYYITSRVESLFIGKFKTVVLFVTIVLAVLSSITFNINNIIHSLIYVVINLQLLSLAIYTINYFKKEQEKPTINKNEIHKEIMNNKYNEQLIDDLAFKSTEDLEEQLEDTLVISDLKEFENQIYDVEKEDIY